MTVHLITKFRELTEEQLLAVKSLLSDDGCATRNGYDVWVETNLPEADVQKFADDNFFFYVVNG